MLSTEKTIFTLSAVAPFLNAKTNWTRLLSDWNLVRAWAEEEKGVTSFAAVGKSSKGVGTRSSKSVGRSSKGVGRSSKSVGRSSKSVLGQTKVWVGEKKCG